MSDEPGEQPPAAEAEAPPAEAEAPAVEAAPEGEAPAAEGDAPAAEAAEGEAPAGEGVEGGEAPADGEGAGEGGEGDPEYGKMPEDELIEEPPQEEDPYDGAGDYDDRPMTGVSEQGAIEIEGFDDDFEEDNFLGEEVKEALEEEEELDGGGELEEEAAPDLDYLIQEAADDRARLQQENQLLQRKLYTIFSTRKTTEVRDAQGKLQAEGQDTRYQQALGQWAEQLEEKDRISRHFETQTFDMKARLEERMTRANDIREAFQTFQLEVARSSENSRTGKPIPERVIGEKMVMEQHKEQEVERVRLKNITLRNQMKKLEAHLKAKEELAEGLHLIDFEQLKIENQSLNEKIEERNEELLKLRKKTTTTVQVLTHLKEKLQFVQRENEVLRSSLESLDSSLAEKRDLLNKEKLERDAFRLENTRIKAQSGIVTNPILLDDIEMQKEKRDLMQERVENLRLKHSQLIAQMQRMQHELSYQQVQGAMLA